MCVWVNECLHVCLCGCVHMFVCVCISVCVCVCSWRNVLIADIYESQKESVTNKLYRAVLFCRNRAA